MPRRICLDFSVKKINGTKFRFNNHHNQMYPKLLVSYELYQIAHQVVVLQNFDDFLGNQYHPNLHLFVQNRDLRNVITPKVLLVV